MCTAFIYKGADVIFGFNMVNNMNVRKAPFRLLEDACSLDQLTDDVITGAGRWKTYAVLRSR